MKAQPAYQEYKLTVDIEKLFNEKLVLGKFEEYLTCTINDEKPTVIGKMVNRKEKKAKPVEPRSRRDPEPIHVEIPEGV